MIEINLLPGSGKKSKGRGGKSVSFDMAGAIAGVRDRVKDPLLAGAVASMVIVGATIAWLHTSQARRETELTERVEVGVRDSIRYAGVLKARARAEAARDTVMRQINIIRAIDEDRYIWPHVLDEVSRALPAYTWLTGLSFNGAPQGNAISQAATSKAQNDSVIPKDEVRVRLSGQTVDIQALTRFMRTLEQSPFLESINLQRSELVLDQGKEVTQFTLDMLYSRPDSTAIRRVPMTVSVR